MSHFDWTTRMRASMCSTLPEAFWLEKSLDEVIEGVTPGYRHKNREPDEQEIAAFQQSMRALTLARLGRLAHWHEIAWCETESPIEGYFFMAMAVIATELGESLTLVMDGQEWGDTPCPVGGWFLEPQRSIGDYRVDFLVRYVACLVWDRGSIKEVTSQLVVECDGHEYHDRTKQQAAKDKSRDRALTSTGHPVMRFTGSEIFKDPYGRAREVMDALMANNSKKSRELLALLDSSG